MQNHCFFNGFSMVPLYFAMPPEKIFKMGFPIFKSIFPHLTEYAIRRPPTAWSPKRFWPPVKRFSLVRFARSLMSTLRWKHTYNTKRKPAPLKNDQRISYFDGLTPRGADPRDRGGIRTHAERRIRLVRASASTTRLDRPRIREIAFPLLRW